jgi:4-hydroxy-3-methylbut-2-enyl diphosphate reductase
VDATCRDVKKIHSIIADNTAPDGLLLVIGDKDHPEVQAAVSYSKCEYRVFKDSGDFTANSNLDLISVGKNVIMVAQTTHKVSDYEKCKEFLQKVYTNAKIFDTICSVTENRQQEAAKLSRECDVMLVVGGKSSSNTRMLYNICKANCENTYFVEEPCDVPKHLSSELNIGIAAGASTPNGLIEEVTNKCQNN